MTVLITGTTGFIGSGVVIQLAKRELSIVAADLNTKSKLKKLVESVTILRKKY